MCMAARTIVAEGVLILSSLTYAVFWIWAVLHATHTPRASMLQRLVWGLALIINPTTVIWYWCIWKRTVFWLLFTPVLGLVISMPLVIHSLLQKGDETRLTNLLFAFGNTPLLLVVSVLLIFPFLLRFNALLDVGKNAALSAMDRNDWIVTFALPVFGFGAAMSYCVRERKMWAVAGLLWMLVFGFSVNALMRNIMYAVLPFGDEKREAYLQH